MNQKEARRVYVVEQIAHGALTAPQAGEILDLSVRQIRRLKDKYVAEGPSGLAHGNRGRQPAHTINDDVRALVKQLAQTAYRGASFNHMEELMASHHEIVISTKSIGRILKEASITLPHARKGAKKCGNTLTVRSHVVQIIREILGTHVFRAYVPCLFSWPSQPSWGH